MLTVNERYRCESKMFQYLVSACACRWRLLLGGNLFSNTARLRQAQAGCFLSELYLRNALHGNH
jgi:hypothetical protein